MDATIKTDSENMGAASIQFRMNEGVTRLHVSAELATQAEAKKMIAAIDGMMASLPSGAAPRVRKARKRPAAQAQA